MSTDEHLANVLGAVALDVMTRVAGAVEAATGLSMVQATAVSALANYADGSSVDDLRRAVDLSHSATVRLVDRLVDAALVERRASSVDGRVAAVHLTRAGRACARRIRTARMRELTAAVAALPAAQRAILAPALDTLAARDVDPAPAGVAASRYVCRLCDPGACGHPAHCPVTNAGTD